MNFAITRPSNVSNRLLSIDALRGIVMLLMLLDHVRETFFLHMQVPDPMIAGQTPADLFFSRFTAHLCAPVFIFLTGLSAYLYGSKKTYSQLAISQFLFKRGLFLIILELTLINFAWTFQLPPAKIFLQVIWAIGFSMIALAILLWLPRWLLVVLTVLLIAGHNLLDTLHFPTDHFMHIPWAILHDRGWIEITDSIKARTSYPILPWIGLIIFGYLAGSWFTESCNQQQRLKKLNCWGVGLLVGFICLRTINIYGDKPWILAGSWLDTVMSFLNITKYPPSLLFIMLTLGIGLLLLRLLEIKQNLPWLKPLVTYGSVPMFFYILHLYVLKFLYLIAVVIWGTNQGEYLGFDHVAMIWLVTIILVILFYPFVKLFSQFKARRKDLIWLKYL